MSVFLAVLLSAVMMFNNVLAAAIKLKGAQAMAENILKSAIYSTLADFDYNVKEKYGLYMIYQDNVPFPDKINGYIDDNIEFTNGNRFLHMELKSSEIEAAGFSHLSNIDNQIMEYCKYRIPLNVIEEFLTRSEGLFKKLGVSLSSGSTSENAGGSDENSSEIISDISDIDEEKYRNYDKREQAKNIFEDFQENQNGSQTKGNIIENNIYIKLPSRISDAYISDFKEYAGKIAGLDPKDENAEDEINKCINDIFNNDKYSFNTLYNELLLNEYILNVFNSRVMLNNENSYLRNEVEYILFGDKSDDSNLNYFKMVTLLVRYILNTIYIYSNEQICNVAEITSFLVTALLEFQGQSAVKHAIILSWSFVESWEDMKLLENGEKVPVYKSDETCRTWINYNKDASAAFSMTYKDYLRVFLMIIPKDIKLMRILDLIQINELKEKSDFTIMESVTFIKLKCVIYFDKRKTPFIMEAGYGY